MKKKTNTFLLYLTLLPTGFATGWLGFLLCRFLLDLR
jgi:hypothetical protein